MSGPANYKDNLCIVLFLVEVALFHRKAWFRCKLFLKMALLEIVFQHFFDEQCHIYLLELASLEAAKFGQYFWFSKKIRIMFEFHHEALQMLLLSLEKMKTYCEGTEYEAIWRSSCLSSCSSLSLQYRNQEYSHSSRSQSFAVQWHKPLLWKTHDLNWPIRNEYCHTNYQSPYFNNLHGYLQE